MAPRRDYFLVNPQNVGRMINWFLSHAATDASLPTRINKLLSFFTQGGALMKECVTAHCEVAEMFARRLGSSRVTQQAVRYSYERWDGKGAAFQLGGPDTPVAARVLHLMQALEVAHRFGGAEAAKAIAKERRGSDFDPGLVDSFLQVATDRGFWAPVQRDSVQETVLAMGPPSSFRPIEDADVATVCDVLADFTDIKARRTWHHSRVVAEVATRIGRNLGLHERELVSLERAGLVHDLGKAGVPCAILVKQTALSEPEAERLRLHARYSELVLEKVERLRGLAEIAGAHHEWFDGSGYHRRLAGEQIPLAARVLGLADAYSLAVQSADAAAEPEAVLDRFRPLVGKQFDPDCFEALLGTSPLQAESRTRTTTRSLVERLTTREIEVLRQVALGQSNRRVAETLVISEKTVEHHLDHIYGKLGVSCRTSAVVFAVHQGLI